MNRILKEAFAYNDQDALRHVTRFVAKWVKDKMDDRQLNNSGIDDQTMQEINRCVRNGIYDALYTLTNSSISLECLLHALKTEQDTPKNLEEPELRTDLSKHLHSLNSKEIKFESAFLNEQLSVGNIYRLPDTLLIRSKSILELKDMDTDLRKKNLNKISAQLRREGYAYDPCTDAYMKPIDMNKLSTLLKSEQS